MSNILQVNIFLFISRLCLEWASPYSNMYSEIQSKLNDINNKINNILSSDSLDFMCVSLLHNSLLSLDNQLNIMSSKIIIKDKINPKPQIKKQLPVLIPKNNMLESSDSESETPDGNKIELKPYEKYSIYDPEYYFDKNDSIYAKIEKLNKVIGTSTDKFGVELSKNQRVKRNKRIKKAIEELKELL